MIANLFSKGRDMSSCSIRVFKNQIYALTSNRAGDPATHKM